MSKLYNPVPPRASLLHKQNHARTLNDRFVDIADWISHAMGTPANILLWILFVLAWILLFALNPAMQSTNILPAWFTSNAFNFPLNTVTTLAELYIGFLVAAAANRVERNNRLLQEQQMKIVQHIDATAVQEEQEIEHAEAELMEEDKRMEAIMLRLDKQDGMILEILKRMEKT